MERYYLKMKGQRGPTVPHENLAAAYAEAYRLLKAVPEGKLVYVLQVIGTVNRDDLRKKARPAPTEVS